MAALPPPSGDQEGTLSYPNPGLFAWSPERARAAAAMRWLLSLSLEGRGRSAGSGEASAADLAPTPAPRRCLWAGRTRGEAGPAGPARHPRPFSARRVPRGGRRTSRGSAPSPAAHGGAGSNLGRMGAAPRRQPPEDPFRRRLPPSSASRLNCGVRIDWECKWQLKCNLHSQQEQGGGKERATGGWPWAGGGSGRNGPGWAKPPPQPQALPQTPWVIAPV